MCSLKLSIPYCFETLPSPYRARAGDARQILQQTLTTSLKKARKLQFARHLTFLMLPRTKREVKLFEMRCFTMFITALRVILLMQLRWPKNKSLWISVLVFDLFLYFVARVTRQLQKKFCPWCGNNTLLRIPMTIDDQGETRFYLPKRSKPFNIKRKKVSCTWLPLKQSTSKWKHSFSFFSLVFASSAKRWSARSRPSPNWRPTSQSQPLAT